MSNLQRCSIKSIISPGDYWMTKYYEGRSEVDELQERLSREIRCSKNCIRTEVTPGQIVAVQHPNNKELYLRAKVKNIFIKNSRYTYEVFLIDHGMHIDVERSRIEFIANSIIRNKEPAAFKVHLYGVQPIQPSDKDILNWGETGFKWEVSKIWVPSALAYVKRKLQEFDEIYIKCQSIVNNVVVAKIFLKDSVTETVKSLAELLIDNRFAIQKEGNNLSVTSKIAPSSSDGDHSISNLLPVDILEIQEIQAKLELVNKWRMEHVMDCASKSELEDSWTEEDASPCDSLEKKIEEKKPKRQKAGQLLEKLKKQNSNVPHLTKNTGSLSYSSNSLQNSPSSVSSRSSELLEKLAKMQLKGNQSLCSESSGSNKMESKTKNVVNKFHEDLEDDEDDFDFEEPMPIKPDVVEKLEPVLIDDIRSKACSKSSEFKIIPAGRIAPDLPKEIKKKKVKNKASSYSSNEPPVLNVDPWIINVDPFMEPKHHFKDIPFAKEIHENLQKENLEALLPLQRYAIPCIRRQENVVMIAPSKSGKTMSYVLPLIDSVLEAEELEERQVYAVVITSSGNSVRFIHSMCQSFLSPSMQKKIQILAVDEESSYMKPSRCHVLITTPNVFINYINNLAFDLKELNFLIIDNADILLNPMPIVESVLNSMGYKLIKEQCVMIVACRHWTADLYDITKKVQKKFSYLISSNTELAVFNQVRCDVLKMSKNVFKADVIMRELRKIMLKKKILILCKEESEFYKLTVYLETLGIVPLVVYKGLDKKTLLENESSWKRLGKDSAPVLLCTFDTFNEITIEDTDVLIYYTLPSSFKQFDNHLSCFKRNLKEFSNPKAQKEMIEEQMAIIMLVDYVDKTLCEILKVAERLDSSIPEDLLLECDEIYRNDNHSESKKDCDGVSVMFCSNILEAGECSNESLCPYRHAFSKDLDSVVLPYSGEIVFQILQVDHSTSFWARLLEEEEISTGSMKRVKNNEMAINIELVKFYKHEENRIQLQSFKEGDICAVKYSGVFYRVQILKCNERNIFEVVVRRLDSVSSDKKILMTVKPDELYELPPEASRYPPQIVQICLSNISLTSAESEKSAVSFINDLISKSEKDDVWSGRVVFSINNTILLKDIKVQSFKESNDDFLVSEIFIKQHFIDNNWAVKDLKHLNNMYKLAESAGINFKSSIKREELVLTERTKSETGAKRKTKSETSSGKCEKVEHESILRNFKPEWASFEEPFTQVEFLRAENTSLLFLRQRKYKKKLAKLESECHAEGEKIKKNIKDGSSFRTGDYCLAKAKNNQRWRRARIESQTSEGFDVLFLDHADFQYVQHKDVIPMPEAFLQKLPFQAVECGLIGIKHSRVCSIEVINEIYNFSNSGKDDLIAQQIRDDLIPKVLKGQKKYDVNLLSLQGKSLNKHLIDSNLVKAMKSEADYVKDSDDILVEDEQSSSV